MKRTVTLLAGVAVLGVLGYVSSRLWAQTPGAPAQTRIAVINLYQTLHRWEKYKVFHTDLKTKMDQLGAEDDKLKVEILKYQQGIQTNQYKDQKSRENAEAWITKLNRDREDLRVRVKRDFGPSSEVQFVAMYKEFEDTVKKFATPSGYHLVLQYNDPSTTEIEKYSPMALREKLANTACVPLFAHDSVDITNTIASILNQTYRTRVSTPIVPTGGTNIPGKK